MPVKYGVVYENLLNLAEELYFTLFSGCINLMSYRVINLCRPIYNVPYIEINVCSIHTQCALPSFVTLSWDSLCFPYTTIYVVPYCVLARAMGAS